MTSGVHPRRDLAHRDEHVRAVPPRPRARGHRWAGCASWPSTCVSRLAGSAVVVWFSPDYTPPSAPRGDLRPAGRPAGPGAARPRLNSQWLVQNRPQRRRHLRRLALHLLAGPPRRPRRRRAGRRGHRLRPARPAAHGVPGQRPVAVADRCASLALAAVRARRRRRWGGSYPGQLGTPAVVHSCHPAVTLQRELPQLWNLWDLQLCSASTQHRRRESPSTPHSPERAGAASGRVTYSQLGREGEPDRHEGDADDQVPLAEVVEDRDSGGRRRRRRRCRSTAGRSGSSRACRPRRRGRGRAGWRGGRRSTRPRKISPKPMA